MEQLREATAITTIEDVAERYDVGDMLGEGRFSQVFSAVRKGQKASGAAAVALKVIEKSTLDEDEEAAEALVQEVTALRHAFAAAGRAVPKVHEVLDASETVYVVMDQIAGCELFELLDEMEGSP